MTCPTHKFRTGEEAPVQDSLTRVTGPAVQQPPIIEDEHRPGCQTEPVFVLLASYDGRQRTDVLVILLRISLRNGR